MYALKRSIIGLTSMAMLVAPSFASAAMSAVAYDEQTHIVTRTEVNPEVLDARVREIHKAEAGYDESSISANKVEITKFVNQAKCALSVAGLPGGDATKCIVRKSK